MLTFKELQIRIAELDRPGQGLDSISAQLPAKQALVRQVLDHFERTYGPSSDLPVAACFVPGRVEILGKHTDYAGGRSVLGAVDRGFFCISGRNGRQALRLAPVDSQFPPCELGLAGSKGLAEGHWGRYPLTMARRLVANFGSSWDGAPPGADVAFGCDLPVAAGLSGSSALMIMTFFALAVPNQLMASTGFLHNIADARDLAMYLACAENGQTFRGLAGSSGVGTFGGSEDHTEILNARRGALSVFRFCPTRHEKDLPLPDELRLVVAHSGVKAEKTGAAMEHYNRVSLRARLAVEAYNQHFGTRHRLLHDIASECGDDLTAHLPALARAFHTGDSSLDLFGRFLQFYREDRELIPGAVAALEARDFAAFGQQIDESHALSALHLRNIVPEIDWLQRSARDLGAVAASGFGAGFGGSAYALVPKAELSGFVQAWRVAYGRTFPQHAGACEFFSTTLSGGAGECFLNEPPEPISKQ